MGVMDRDVSVKIASEEHGLDVWYRPLVLPLLNMERARWPACCGGQCEPCAMLLVRVAERALALLEGA